MSLDFLKAIDAAVEEALPAGWPRVPDERLPACGGTSARHAFRMPEREGPGAYLAIVAVPEFDVRGGGPEYEVATLVELILERGASVLVLYRDFDDPDEWIQDNLCYPHPRLLTLKCQGEALEVEPYWRSREPLVRTIHALWSGELRYSGPTEGPQSVGVEIMRDKCWRCHGEQRTVTGIVLPDREVADWSSPDWTYFQQLVELAILPDSLIPALISAVDAWRAGGDVRLTPVRWRYSRTVGDSCWAAECPACGAFRGAFHVMDDRMEYLGDLASRQRGDLSYRPLELDVSRGLLRALSHGGEVTPHCRPYTWYRGELVDPWDPAIKDLVGAIRALPALDPGLACDAPSIILPTTAPMAPRSTATGFFKRLGQIFATLGFAGR